MNIYECIYVCACVSKEVVNGMTVTGEEIELDEPSPKSGRGCFCFTSL